MKLLGIISCGFRRNRSTTDQLFCIRQILENKWEYNETVHRLQENPVLYNIHIEFVPSESRMVESMFFTPQLKESHW
jgi:hypothetical protein